MTAIEHRSSATCLLVLRAALALLIAVAGLACAQASAATTSAQPAAHSAAAAGPHAQIRAADDASPDATSAPSGCSGKQDQQAEAPVSTRHDAPTSTPVTGPGVPPARGHGDAQVAPGRGGPAPPPSAPSYEELSVLRV